jgi:hypothetical protein
MTEKKRPSAKNILLGVVQAMVDAQEPFDEELALVPAHYEVYIHPRAYQELQSLMPRIKEQVSKRLDVELERLNSRRAGGHGFFKRLFFPLTRLLFADRYFHQEVGPSTYERSGEAWDIEFSVTAEPDAEIDYLMVESDFGVQKQPVYKGRPTINIRRRTTMLPDGRFETVISAKRPEAVPAPRPEPSRERSREQGRERGRERSREQGRERGRATYAPTPAVPAADVLARLSYEDSSGRHIYYMRKAQITLGRHDEPGTSLDVAFHTRPDVSREHLHIRHDARSDAFLVKDLSQYGSTVDGKRLQSSLGTHDEDLDVWHPLPRTAEIGLANIISIHFEAL